VKADVDPSVDRTKDVTIAVDSTGIKVSNRGEWIRRKWAVKKGVRQVPRGRGRQDRKDVVGGGDG
jgi:hypothetical protein